MAQSALILASSPSAELGTIEAFLSALWNAAGDGIPSAFQLAVLRLMNKVAVSFIIDIYS
ncbi:MAG: hypothetical protein ACFFB3_21165 [Candidatus Hodarchaeota archaeon]